MPTLLEKPRRCLGLSLPGYSRDIKSTPPGPRRRRPAGTRPRGAATARSISSGAPPAPHTGGQEIDVLLVVEPSGDPVADAAEGVGEAGFVLRVVTPEAVQEAGVEGIAAQDPAELVGGIDLQARRQRSLARQGARGDSVPCGIACPAGLTRPSGYRPAGHTRRGRQGGQAGVLPLPPVTALVVVWEEESRPPRPVHRCTYCRA